MTVASETADIIAFDNSYARLPGRFFQRVSPTAVAGPRLIRLNDALCRQLGFDPADLATSEGVEILAGNRVPRNGEPLAMAYAGHQFGSFVPQLGDGRAILLGEVIDRDGVRRDIQLKGSGPTPFSRRGDGRAALGPVLREYIVSEAFAALGIPTTRSLAAVVTGETVARERPLPGGVLTRVASSHIRVGTFQYFAAREDNDGVRRLAEYVIARHYPSAMKGSNRYAGLLELVISRQAELIAQWMLVGFIHGVMNTDNMSIAGETIDYGPCAFMDAYHPETVYSSIDHAGRYAFGNQPRIAQWNLARLAECFLPLLADDEEAAIEVAKGAVGAFAPRFNAAYGAGLSRKLGILHPTADDRALGEDLLARMAANGADFTLTFRRLIDAAGDSGGADAVSNLFANPSDFGDWAATWRKRLTDDAGTPEERQRVMRNANPAIIPRNHLVEEAIAAAVDGENFEPFARLVTVLSRPYDDQPAFAGYGDPPRPEQVVHQTFCGT